MGTINVCGDKVKVTLPIAIQLVTGSIKSNVFVYKCCIQSFQLQFFQCISKPIFVWFLNAIFVWISNTFLFVLELKHLFNQQNFISKHLKWNEIVFITCLFRNHTFSSRKMKWNFVIKLYLDYILCYEKILLIFLNFEMK